MTMFDCRLQESPTEGDQHVSFIELVVCRHNMLLKTLSFIVVDCQGRILLKTCQLPNCLWTCASKTCLSQHHGAGTRAGASLNLQVALSLAHWALTPPPMPTSRETPSPHWASTFHHHHRHHEP